MKSLTYISLGAGVQSTALYILSTQGKIERADVAIFADTQDEPAFVYEHLGRLVTWGAVYGGPIVATVTAGCISADTEARHKGQRTRFAAIPVFTMGSDGRATPVRRQCTREYKIEPIEREIRRLLGFQKGQRIAGRAAARALIGISLDEADRMKPSRTSWIENVYPLVDAGLRRRDCIRIIAEAGMPEPNKSACRFCPYHGDAYWRWLKAEWPAEFAKAATFDRVIRDMTKPGWPQMFLHRNLRPLDEIDFDAQGRLFGEGFSNECEGVCGV